MFKGNYSKSKQTRVTLCSVPRLIVVYICVKFRENILDSIRVMERTQIMEALKDGRTDGWLITQNFGGYNTFFGRA